MGGRERWREEGGREGEKEGGRRERWWEEGGRESEENCEAILTCTC